MQYIFEDNLEKLSQQKLKIAKKTIKNTCFKDVINYVYNYFLWFCVSLTYNSKTRIIMQKVSEIALKRPKLAFYGNPQF